MCISDTHNLHNEIRMPEHESVDMVLCSGDISGRGSIGEIRDFLFWYNSLPIKHKVFCAGNHDFGFEDKWTRTKVDEVLASYTDIHYLEDSGVTIDGIKIWGSPQTPWFHNWAFNKQRGEEIKKYWDMIPFDTDILLTHGPAFGYGDDTADGKAVGCVDLWNTLLDIRPKIHIFGHIHEAAGMYTYDKWYTGINASVVNRYYMVVHEPTIINYEDFL